MEMKGREGKEKRRKKKKRISVLLRSSGPQANVRQNSMFVVRNNVGPLLAMASRQGHLSSPLGKVPQASPSPPFLNIKYANFKPNHREKSNYLNILIKKIFVSIRIIIMQLLRTALFSFIVINSAN